MNVINGRLNCYIFSNTPFSYALHAFVSISFNAVPLLVWHLTISALHFSASVIAHFTILWDTVFVNNMRRSGLPICSLSLADIWVKTFALQLCSLHIFLYLQTMRSCPPTITTLMLILISAHIFWHTRFVSSVHRHKSCVWKIGFSTLKFCIYGFFTLLSCFYVFVIWCNIISFFAPLT